MQGHSAEFDPRAYLKTLTTKPGVYRMLDQDGQVIYIGKARNLKKRLSSYFRRAPDSAKTRALVERIGRIEVTVTHTETEALILENTLIKEFKPRYNILLRDDKSYPYIFVSTQHAYPRISLHRGPKREPGRYFGPFPSALAAKECLNLLQKLFPIRQCEDSFFRNRSRPCLQYQIGRCSAPCVGIVKDDLYQEYIRHAMLFLEGKSGQIINELIRRMEQSAQDLDYEAAARHRDLIASLRRIQESQSVSTEHGDLDVIACVVENGVACIQVFYIRGGRNLGNNGFFPHVGEGDEQSTVLTAFLSQYYLASQKANNIREVPEEILINTAIKDAGLLEQALTAQTGHKIRIAHRVRGDRARWLKMAEENARIALGAYLASKANMRHRYEALQEAFGLENLPARLECFDISHTQGEATVASCVVFDQQGPVKADYRRFNIEGITPGDDYAAMEQALIRRYTRLIRGEGKLPDILFIDGGKGQLTHAMKVFEELQITEVQLIAIAKGPQRKPGKETLFLPQQKAPFILGQASPALHLIQQIRDEAHRFAIGGHRQRRAKGRKSSILEKIPGLGPKRRQMLLKQFGGIQEIRRAGVDDLVRSPGISRQLAQRIYDVMHDE